MNSILLVDDDECTLNSLTRALRSPENEISSCTNPLKAIELVAKHAFNLVLCDQRMPEMNGIELLGKITQYQPEIRKILISGYSDFNDVTGAFNAGIIHKFILKPWNKQILVNVVAGQLPIKKPQAHSLLDKAEPLQISPDKSVPESLSGAVGELRNFHNIYSSDPQMMRLFGFIERVANCGAAFFICGETGTGKELFARAIHLESDRARQNFVALNCANLTESLLESQLFGHRKGAFTGATNDQKGLIAAAEKGTLFLDEVTEIPFVLQAKLLRVLQEKEYTPVGDTTPISYDVQIISASSTSLEEAVVVGKMREDLRYRLEVMPIKIPPLRERRGDITALFDHLLESQLLCQNTLVRAVDPEVYRCIQSYQWPGNVRELQNVCTYMAAILQTHDELISMDCLPHNILPIERKTAVSANQTTPDINEKLIFLTLQNCCGNKNAAANSLGISRMTLWRKMKKFGMNQQ